MLTGVSRGQEGASGFALSPLEDVGLSLDKVFSLLDDSRTAASVLSLSYLTSTELSSSFPCFFQWSGRNSVLEHANKLPLDSSSFLCVRV